MIKIMRFVSFFLLFLSIGASAQSLFVRAKGRYLITPSGEKLMLRGINLGNWLEPEGYMFLLDRGAASPREIERLFNELVGPAAANDFWSKYRQRYVTEADIDFIRKAGFNSVRIPLHYKFFLSGGEGFKLLDRVVAWCRQAGLWVILDLHSAPGGQTGTNIDDSWGYPWLFESPRDQQLTVDVWRRIARHYHEEPTILGYDLLNEPIPPFQPLLKYNGALEPLYQRITNAVRQVDNHHLVILEGAQWDGNFAIFGPPFDNNVMYAFHKYKTEPTQSVIQEYLDFRDRYNVPIWLGESGENTDLWIHRFVKLLEKNQVGWCFWPYKKMENHSGVATFEKPAHWDEIVAYAEAPGTSASAEARLPLRPSVEHSRKALRDLLEKILFKNCQINAGYIEALGLSVPRQQTTRTISAAGTLVISP